MVVAVDDNWWLLKAWWCETRDTGELERRRLEVDSENLKADSHLISVP